MSSSSLARNSLVFKSVVLAGVAGLTCVRREEEELVRLHGLSFSGGRVFLLRPRQGTWGCSVDAIGVGIRDGVDIPSSLIPGSI